MRSTACAKQLVCSVFVKISKSFARRKSETQTLIKNRKEGFVSNNDRKFHNK